MSIVNSMKEGKPEVQVQEEEEVMGKGNEEIKTVKDVKEKDKEKGDKESNGSVSRLKISARINLVGVFLYSEKLGDVMTLTLRGEGNTLIGNMWTSVLLLLEVKIY